VLRPPHLADWPGRGNGPSRGWGDEGGRMNCVPPTKFRSLPANWC
jgi:hypothetical protein